MHHPESINIRHFVERMGAVHRQPFDIEINASHLMTINFRAPLAELQQLVPNCLRVEEVAKSGLGIISLSSAKMDISRLGFVSLSGRSVVEWQYGVHVLLRQNGKLKRCRYILRTDTSLPAYWTWLGHFSPVRSVVSNLDLQIDQEQYWAGCQSADPLGNAHIRLGSDDISSQTPFQSIFGGLPEATTFILDNDGNCGFDYRNSRLLYQHQVCPKWDSQFGHSAEVQLPLFEYLFDLFDINAEYDSALYVESGKLKRLQSEKADASRWKQEAQARRRSVRRDRVDKSLEKLS